MPKLKEKDKKALLPTLAFNQPAKLNISSLGGLMKEAIFEISMGRLLCGNVREIIEMEVFYGRKIRWREGRGILSRTFLIMGEPNDVKAIAERLTKYAKAVNSA